MKNKLVPATEIYELVASNYYPGMVTLLECDVCGHLQWGGTSTKETNGYRVETTGDCLRCNQVAMRAPEIFAWALSVVIKAQRDLTSNLQESRDN